MAKTPATATDEISFEDAAGSSDISFEDATGPAGEPPAPRKSVLDFSADAAELSKRWGFQPGELETKPDDSFAAEAGKTMMRAIVSLQAKPKEALTGGVKAAVSGVEGLGEAAIAGINGLVQMVRKGKGDAVGMAVQATEEGQQFARQHIKPIVEQITTLNLTPENDQEQGMQDLLMLLPKGIHAAGETVYEKTGNALAAAGTEGLLTLLTLKPGIVTKVFKASPKAMEGLGEVAVKDPKAAGQLVDHVKETDPKTAAKMEIQVAEAQAKPLEKGEQVGKQQTKGIEVSVEEGLADSAAEVTDQDLGQHTIEIPGGSMLAQETGKYLQVKRADVLPAERGKGKAQEMMARLYEQAQTKGLVLSSDVTVSPDAQRVYDGLAKRGFSIKENPSTVNETTGSKVSADPRVPVYEVLEAPPSEAAKTQATQIFANGPTLADLPGAKFTEGKLKAWYDEIIRTINPEALGDKAKMSAAVLANKIAEQMHMDAANWGRSAERRAFWNRNVAKIQEFIERLEKGQKQPDEVMEKAAENIRQRNKEIYDRDVKNGIEYDPIDNYLYHVFKDSEAVAGFFQRKYGAKWGDPSFTKDRAFDFYKEAIAAGFEPRFTNPEEIMLARQHASNVAQMRIELLADMEIYGLAKKITKDSPDPPPGTRANYRRSPNGDGYWVDVTADAVLHNAFDTKSLWNMKGIRGDLFKSAMFLKNALVPIKLALSLFHPLHVITIDNATGMVRATKELLSGQSNPLRWLKGMTTSALYKGFVSSPRMGYRLLKAYQGKVDPVQLTDADKTSLQYMAEGGMIPEISAQYQTRAIESFHKAIQTRSATAAWHLPFAALEALGKPMFQIWIPSLKIASYLKDVGTTMKVNPDLALNKAPRLLALRRIAKSIDNRYGEMAYSTLFWNKMVKDLMVANTLSLGWQLGFLREYGGGMMDIGQSVTRAGSLADKAKTGMLDRPLFVTFYTTQALLYGGLLTWALTGKPPSDLLDYIYPKNGDKNDKGEDERMNTMFYPREFASIYKHVQHQGLIEGVGHLVSSKASGLIGMTSEWASGVNSFDQEIRDPDGPLYKQIQQTLAATLTDLEPISIGAVRESDRSLKSTLLGFGGFNKAPKYVTQSQTEAQVTQLYRKYNSPRQTSYEKALLSNDTRELKAAFKRGDMDKYSELLDKITEKYELTPKEQGKLANKMLRSQGNFNSVYEMYKQLDWRQQRRLLDNMSDEERDVYLPMSNKEHLRYRYEPPEKSGVH